MWWQVSHAIDAVSFDGRIPQKQCEKAARDEIRAGWECGALPIQSGKRWIVGYDVRRTFFSTSGTAIYVGPAKPSKFRDHYVKVKVTL